MIHKLVDSIHEAVAEIHDGATVMIGGFGEAGSPIELIHALIDQGAKDLTVVNNNTGSGHVGLAGIFNQFHIDHDRARIRTGQTLASPALYDANGLPGGHQHGHGAHGDAHYALDDDAHQAQASRSCRANRLLGSYRIPRHISVCSGLVCIRRVDDEMKSHKCESPSRL